jgi:hypothetical protein
LSVELFSEMGRASSKGATRSGFASAARGARSNGAKTGRILGMYWEASIGVGRGCAGALEECM